ncbi:replication gene A [Musicola paradisiaca Ech703]|uniref:Replication gene A n=2 Tax=Musicola paradisiaca TaxID=69223 RepID=C6C6X9_MUSP7|nr:replication gene A [Musicola paradisiaca Ech703]
MGLYRHITSDDWCYDWNVPRQAIGAQLCQLPTDMMRQGQAVLFQLNSLPRCLSARFRQRFEYLKRQHGLQRAFRYLLNIVHDRLWPRIHAVQRQYCLDTTASCRLLSESEHYHQLPDMSDNRLRRFAARIAALFNDAYNTLSEHFLQRYPEAANQQQFSNDVQQTFYGELSHMALSLHITPVNWSHYQRSTLTLPQAFAGLIRLVTPRWWERQLRIQRNRWREALFIACGEVNRATTPYISRQSLLDIRARRLATMDYLKRCELENIQNGERTDLLDKVMSSVANPDIRRMELMTIIAGIERYAATHNHIGMFITLTAPGKYHPTRTRPGGHQVVMNRQWLPESPSPKATQRYLVNLWGKIRTALKDRRLPLYGLRVVEPHHDGTPHWHMMLYCDPAQRAVIVDILRRYILRDEENLTARQADARFNCRHLNKGGAAAYIAKYVAKNIDGYALDNETDHETGKPLKDVAAAVSAWASLWRIPQFHFIGLPTLGAYRECRRIRARSLSNPLDEQAETVRIAADAGDFAAYIHAQGGANTPRQQQAVRVARVNSHRLNAYDETITRTVGIFSSHRGSQHIVVTRPDEWRIVPKQPRHDAEGDTRTPWSSVNNCGRRTFGNLSGGVPDATQRESADENKEGGIQSFTFSQPDKKPLDKKPPDVSVFHDIPRAPSARLSYHQRNHLASLAPQMQQRGIHSSRWEREALARGANVIIDSQLLDEFKNKSISAFDE